MKEWVGGGKLIIISMTPSSIVKDINDFISPSIGRYQFILLGEQMHVCLDNSSEVVARKRNSRGSNARPFSHKSNALITPPGHLLYRMTQKMYHWPLWVQKVPVYSCPPHGKMKPLISFTITITNNYLFNFIGPTVSGMVDFYTYT